MKKISALVIFKERNGEIGPRYGLPYEFLTKSIFPNSWITQQKLVSCFQECGEHLNKAQGALDLGQYRPYVAEELETFQQITLA